MKLATNFTEINSKLFFEMRDFQFKTNPKSTKIFTDDGCCVSDCSKVSLRCSQCRADRLNWDQPFAVSASCDECNAAPQHIRFSWSLYLVDVSSKPVVEGNKRERFACGRQQRQNRKPHIPFYSLLVPFCYAADLSAPAAVVGPFSPRTPEVSHSSGVPRHTAAPETSAFVPRAEDVFETTAKNRQAADGRNETAEVNRPAPGAFKHAQDYYYY